jgi:ATPase family AAA domain-containing protein 3A/B
MMGEETQHQNERAKFQDQLARKRMQDQAAEQARLQDEERRRQEESVRKQEELRQRSVEYAEKVRHEYEMKKLQAELKGKAQIERENREIYLEQIKLKSEEQRKTVLESIKTAGNVIGTGITTLLENPNKILMATGGITLLALGVYTARGATQTAVKYLDSRLGKPSLIRETSRTTLLTTLRSPVTTIRRYFSKAEDSLQGVVLDPALESRLREIAISTRFTKRNYGLFRNLLMHGPPGTGKTLFAKKLAAHSGLDYAIMTGGDVAPLGREAVTAIHKVFDWSQTSRRGLLLFIDEADAFLRKRATEKIGEDMRAALNAFLYRTGEQSSRFMLVLASNEPEQFDWAVNDRLDEMVQFNLPSLAERRRMTYLYFDSYILKSAERRRPIKIGAFDFEKKCEELAQRTDGFSGREIAKLLAACQASAYASEDATLTEEMIDKKLRDALESHLKKVEWRAEEER